MSALRPETTSTSQSDTPNPGPPAEEWRAAVERRAAVEYDVPFEAESPSRTAPEPSTPAQRTTGGLDQLWRYVVQTAEQAARRRPLAVGYLLLALVVVPAAAAYGVHFYVSRSHLVLETTLVLSSGSADPVTSMMWDPGTERRLLVGTKSGRLVTFSGPGASPTISPAVSSGPVVGIAAEGDEVRAIALAPNQVSPNAPAGGLGQPLTVGPEECLSGFVWREGSVSDLVCVEPASRERALRDNALVTTVESTDPTAPLECLGDLVSRLAFAGDRVCVSVETRDATEDENRLDQSRKVLPDAARDSTRRLVLVDREIERGLVAVANDMAIVGSLDVDGGPADVEGLGQWVLGDGAVEVGPIAGIEDARALARLPGTSIVIAGDGGGSVFAIDTSMFVSQFDPSQYLLGLGSHDAAITSIAVPDRLSAGGPSFATAAADGTAKVWFGGDWQSLAAVDRVIDVAPAGSQWIAEVVDATVGATWRSLEALSEDGRWAAATSEDGTLFLIDLPPGQVQGELAPVAQLPNLTAPVAFSPDGRLFAAYNPATGATEILTAPFRDLRRTLLFRGTAVPTAIAFSDSGNRLGVRTDEGASIFDVTTGAEIASIQSGGEQIVSHALSPDGAILALNFANGPATILNVDSGDEIASVPASGAIPSRRQVSFTKSGKHLRLFDGDLSRLITYGMGAPHRSETTVVAGWMPIQSSAKMSADGTRVVAGLPDNSALVIVDVASDTELFRADTASIRSSSALSSTDASRIAALTSVGEVAELLVYREEPDTTKHGPMPPLAQGGLQLSADGSTLLYREPSGRLHIANLRSDAIVQHDDDIVLRIRQTIAEHLGVELGQVTDEASYVDDLRTDDLDLIEIVMALEEEFGIEMPDDRVEAIETVADTIDTVREILAETAASADTEGGLANRAVRTVVVRPDGTIVAPDEAEGTTAPTTSEQPAVELGGSPDTAASVDTTEGGLANRTVRTVVVRPDGTIVEGDVSEGTSAEQLTDQLSGSSGTIILSDTLGGTAASALSVPSEGTAILTPILPDIRATEVELMPDGSGIVAGDASGAIQLIDLATGNRFEIVGHGHVVHQMAVSSDGAFLASASLDGRLRITDLERSRLVAALPLSSLSSRPEPSRLAPRFMDARAPAVRFVLNTSSETSRIEAVQKARELTDPLLNRGWNVVAIATRTNEATNIFDEVRYNPGSVEDQANAERLVRDLEILGHSLKAGAVANALIAAGTLEVWISG